MPTEEKKKIQAWIPVSIWIQIESFGFKSQNEAVNTAFEKLIEIQDNNQVESKENQIESKNNQIESNTINELRARLEEKDTQIEKTQRQIKNMEESLRKAPDLAEFARLQARSEELEKHNETLKKELDKASQDKEDLKETHKNYMIQVQTLINQKAIEAPGNKKAWYKFW